MPISERVKNEVEQKKKKKSGSSSAPQQVITRPAAKQTSAFDVPNWRKTSLSKQQTSRVNNYQYDYYNTNAPKYNYQSTPANQWDQAQYAAYGRLTGDDSVFDQLANETNSFGTQFGNPYRAKQSTLPNEIQSYLRENLDYDGPFDQEFMNNYWSMYEPYLQHSDIGYTATKPGKKGTKEQWIAYYLDQVGRYLTENRDTDSQWNDYREKSQNKANEFKQLYGRVPSLEEFRNLEDISNYSKLSAIDESLSRDGDVNLEKTIQILPTGTFYSPDVIPGLYQAWLNGDDITNDRDYFDDAVQYHMSPVQASPSVKKYPWSDSDLSGMTPEDRSNYSMQLKANGSYEEAEAFDYALYAADQKARGVEVQPSILQQTIGFYKDDNWFNAAHERLDANGEYQKRLNQDGSMDNPGSKASAMDKACYELYKAERTRVATDEAEAAFNDVKNKIIDYTRRNITMYTAGQLSDGTFKNDLLEELDLDHNTPIKNYIKALGDSTTFSDKYCRRMPISYEAIDTLIQRASEGKDISKNIDYSAIPMDEYEAPFMHVQPASEPPFYRENQRQLAMQRSANRANAEREAVDAIVALADSGVPASSGALPVLSEAYESSLALGERVSGVLANIWSSVRNSELVQKLGESFDIKDAMAVDPVLNQLDATNMPQDTTVADIEALVDANTIARVNDEDITLATGIVGYALPGSQHLAELIANRANDVRGLLAKSNQKFNVGVYKGVYEDRIEAGLSEEDAADVAYFAATDLNAAMGNIGSLYMDNADLKSASDDLIASITSEEGAKDSYEVIKAVSDDVMFYILNNDLRPYNNAPVTDFKFPASTDVEDYILDSDVNLNPNTPNTDIDLSDLHAALVVGASEAADPGFRARTNQILHDISDGTIQPEDIAEGLGYTLTSDLDMALNKVTPEYAQNFMANYKSGESLSAWEVSGNVRYNGKSFTREQYDALMDEARRINGQVNFLYTSGNLLDNVSPELAEALNFDGIDAIAADLTDNYHMPTSAYWMKLDAVEAFAHPDKVYHTNLDMENYGTNIYDAIEEYAGDKTDEQITQNAGNTERSKFRGWIEDDPLGIRPYLASYFGQYESDTGKMYDLFTNNGKYFALNEVSALFNSYYDGRLTLREVQQIVTDRKNNVDEEYVNALQRPSELRSSYSTMQSAYNGLVNGAPMPRKNDHYSDLLGFEDYGEAVSKYPDLVDKVDPGEYQDILDYYHAGAIDENNANNRINEMLARTGVYAEDEYATPEQLEGIKALTDFYQQLGPAGYYLAALDNDNLKLLTNGAYDAEAYGLENYSALEIMNRLDPGWMKPYGLNPGTDNSLEYIVAGGTGNAVLGLLRIPTLVGRMFKDVGYAIAGGEYDPNQDNSYFGKVYQAGAQSNKNAAEYRANVATPTETLFNQVVSEVVRNAITSGIGSIAADKYAGYLAKTFTGMPISGEAAARMALTDAITDIEAMDKIINSASKIVLRGPFAGSVLFNSYDENRNAGRGVLASGLRSTVEAGIELFTEDLPFEKIPLDAAVQKRLAKEATSGIQLVGNYAAMHACNLVKSMVSEIGEEEASEVLGRVVDVFDTAIGGGTFKESLAAFDAQSLPKAMTDTAVSTALTTLMFGAVNLGGSTYDLITRSAQNGTEVDIDRLLRAIDIDYYATADERRSSGDLFNTAEDDLDRDREEATLRDMMRDEGFSGADDSDLDLALSNFRSYLVEQEVDRDQEEATLRDMMRDEGFPGADDSDLDLALSNFRTYLAEQDIDQDREDGIIRDMMRKVGFPDADNPDLDLAMSNFRSYMAGQEVDQDREDSDIRDIMRKAGFPDADNPDIDTAMSNFDSWRKERQSYNPATQVPSFGDQNVSVEENNLTQAGPEAASDVGTESMRSEMRAARQEASTSPSNSELATPSETSETIDDQSVARSNTPQNSELAATSEAKTTDDANAKIEAAEDAATEAAKVAQKNPTAENIQAYKDSANNLQAAMDEKKAMKAQQKLEQQQQAQAEEAEETEEVEEQPAEPVYSTPAAQEVADYIKDSKPAIDRAIVNKGSDTAAEQAVADDPGLASRQEAIDKQVQKIESLEQEIQQIASSLNLSIAQYRQIARAAVDEGIDPTVPSPQTINAQYAKQEQISGLQADQAKTQKKADDIKKEVDAEQKALEAEKERLKAEAKAKAQEDLQKKIDEEKKKLFPADDDSDPRTRKAATREVAKGLRRDLMQSTEQSVNRQAAESNGLRVISDYSDDQRKTSKTAARAEIDDRLKTYSEELPTTGDIGATERFLAPEKWSNPNVEEVEEGAWKDININEKNELQERADYKTRLFAGFERYRERNARTGKIYPVEYEIYKEIKAKAEDARLEGLSDRRFAYIVSANQKAAEGTDVRVSYDDGETWVDTSPREEYTFTSGSEDATALDNIISEDGFVSDYAASIIQMADPEFETRYYPPGSKGQTGPRLKVETENAHYLVLTPVSGANVLENTRENFDEYQRYQGLTTTKVMDKIAPDGKTGMQRLDDSIKSVSSYIEKLEAGLLDYNKELEKANAAFDAAPPSKKEAAAKAVQAAEANVKRRINFLNDQRTKLDKLNAQKADAVHFILYFESKPREERRQVFYVIDKERFKYEPITILQSAIDRVQKAMEKMADLSDDEIRKLAIASDPASKTDTDGTIIGARLNSVGDILNGKYDGMFRADLLSSLHRNLLRDQLKKLNFDSVKDSVHIVEDYHDEHISSDKGGSIRLNTILEALGGFSNAGEFGEGGKDSIVFSDRPYFGKSKKFVVTEEALLKYGTEEQRKELGIDTTKAQYDVDVEHTIQEYVNAKNLSETDKKYLLGEFRVSDSLDVGNARIVGEDDTHSLGVPKNRVDDPSANLYIKEDTGTGSLSIDIAKDRLASKLQWMMEMAEREGPNYRLDLDRNSIVAYDVASGKKRRVGDFYTDNGVTKRWFPSYDDLLENSSKIVCNFPCLMKDDNVHFKPGTEVSFTLFLSTDGDERLAEARANRKFGINLENNRSDLAFTRGHKELLREYQRLADLRDTMFGKDVASSGDVGRNIDLAIFHAKYNLTLNRYKKALEFASFCSQDKVDAARQEVAKYKVKLDEIRSDIERAESSTVNVFAERSKQLEEEKKWHTAKPQDYYIERHVDTSPRSYTERLAEAKERLAHLEGIVDQYGDMWRESESPIVGPRWAEDEALVLKSFIPYLEKLAAQETNRQENNEPEAQPVQVEKPASTMPEELGIIGNNVQSEQAIQTEQAAPIESFRGDHSFLSNFYEAPIELDGITYRNAEAAFQAQKLENAEERARFANLSGKEAKALGRKVQLRADWNDVRLDAMREVVEAKFQQNQDLMDKLLATGNADLVEGNTWNDTFWGVSKGVGENNLGKILMDVRGQNTQTEALPSFANMDIPSKLAVLKSLEDSGENVSDARSELIEAYHEEQSKDLKGQELLDYWHGVAEYAKTHKDSYIIDPNTDYEAKLAKAIDDQLALERSRMGKRLKTIAKRAGTYQKLGAMTKIMDELNAMEKAGLDVANVRQIMQSNIDVVNGNSSPLAETIKLQAIESVAEDDVQKIDLQLHAAETNEQAAASVMEEMEPFISEMDIARGEAADAMLAGMQEGAEPAPIMTGFESLVEAATDTDPTRFNGMPLNDVSNALKWVEERIGDLNSEISRKDKKIEEFEKSIADNQKIVDGMVDRAASFTAEDRETFNRASASIRGARRTLDNIKSERAELISRRQELKRSRNFFGTGLAQNTKAQQILNDRATLSPELIAGTNKHGDFVVDRQSVRQLGKDFVKKLAVDNPYGRNTAYTADQEYEAFKEVYKEDDLIEENSIARTVRSALKERQQAAYLLELGKSFVDLKTDEINEDTFNNLRNQTIGNIMNLTRNTDFSEAGVIERGKRREHAVRAVDAFMDHIQSNMLPFSSTSNVYDLLDHQMLALNNGMEKAKKFVSDYFRVGTDDLRKAFTGENGGREPISVLKTYVGVVLNSFDKKKNKNLHPVSGLFDNIQRVIGSFLGGNEAAIINAHYIDPLMKSNGLIAKHRMSIDKEKPKIKNKAMRSIVTECLDNGFMTEDSVREAHPELTHEQAVQIVDAASYYRKLFDNLLNLVNVVRARNGLPPLKRRNNYVPYIEMEKAGLLRWLGINTTFDELPSGMLGLTSDTKPSHQYNPFEQERKRESMDGLITDIDEIVQHYLNYMLPQIYRTDGLIRLNDFIDALGGFEVESVDEEGHKIKEWKRGHLDFDNSGEKVKYNLGTFVYALRAYRDMMAGKKVGYVDRTGETKLTRKIYGIMDALTYAQGKAKIGGNLRPVVLNSIPLITTAAIWQKDTAIAIAETIQSRASKDLPKIREISDFAASRLDLSDKGSHPVLQFIDKILFAPMEISDSLVTEIVWRAAYRNAYRRYGDNERAKLQADKYCLSIMADKSTGNKGLIYHSRFGNVVAQFTLESVNEIRALTTDIPAYIGIDGATGNPSLPRGVLKGIVSYLLMALGFYGINELVGGNAAIDPIGSYLKAKGNAGEKASFGDVAKAFGTNVLQTLNPIENITGGNLLDAPVPSAIKNTITNTYKGFSGLFNEGLEALMSDDPNDSFDLSWAENFADVAFEWLPGGTAMKRAKTAIQAADKGYAESGSGDIKYIVNKDGFDIPMSVLFGTSASREGRDYTYGRVNKLDKTETERAKDLIKYGSTPSDAINSVRGTNKANATYNQAVDAAKFGDDNTELLEKAKSLRMEAGMPSDISSYAAQNIDTPWMRKAIDLYNETGLVTYPKGLGKRIKEGERNGEKVKYLQSGGKNYIVTDEEVQRMTDEYNRKAAIYINNYDDPEVIADKLDKLPDQIKKDVIGGK